MTDKLREALEKTRVAIEEQVGWDGPTDWTHMIAYIEAALQEPQQSPPAHKLVPIEPTPRMIDRGGREIAFQIQHFGGARTLMHYSSPEIEADNRAKAEHAYRAMLAASEEPPNA